MLSFSHPKRKEAPQIPKPNRKTTTSNEVKDRWKAANYSRINIYLRKEDAERYKAKCEAEGKALSDVPKDAILEYINN